MTKRSRFEQAQRSTEQDRIRDIEAAWLARLSPDQQASFRMDVQAAQARRPERRPDMAPGTAPNPPRPGREPREPKEASSRRSRWT
jgi:hypothetical protein